MQNLPESQIELFEEFKEPPRGLRFFKRNLFSSRVFMITLSYEKTIFLIVVALMVLLASFSLGVERGRHLNDREAPSAPGAALEKGVSPEKRVEEKIATYTIQLKALTDERSAQKEAAFLKSKGYNAFVLKSKDVYKVCVGIFNNITEAEQIYLRLKSRYKDSFIRKR